MACVECGGSELGQDDAGSPVCTRCGTLADPAQAVLAGPHDPGRPPAPTPRNSRGWQLAHTKQDRDRRNSIAMGTFIAAVLSRLGSPGLAPRAEGLFTHAMEKARYRWGRRAKLAAGASVAVALREARRSDALPDIAALLDESPLALSRALRALLALLDLDLPATDPAAHLPALQTHLQSALDRLPKPLAAVLAPLSLQTAVRTASALSRAVSCHAPSLPLAALPTPPTACALLILGLEAEARAPLPHLGELARTLAARFALAPGVVSGRYKALYTLVDEWSRHVPWLDRPPKTPTRSIVAKGIKDVIQFQHEIAHSRMHSVHLDLDPSDTDDGDSDDERAAPPPNKRRRLGGASSLAHRPTCPADALSRPKSVSVPTRLQLLAAARGGSTPDAIPDEELFVEGELDGLLRSEEERVALQPLFDLNWGEDGPKPIRSEMKRGANRVNMDALERLLHQHPDGDSTEGVPSDGGNHAYLRRWVDDTRGSSGDASAAEDVDLSDGSATPDDDDDSDMFQHTANDRYEEEL